MNTSDIFLANGGDDDEQKADKGEDVVILEAGDYNMGDEIGEKVGEGHDPIEDNQ